MVYFTLSTRARVALPRRVRRSPADALSIVWPEPNEHIIGGDVSLEIKSTLAKKGTALYIDLHSSSSG